LAVSGAYRGHIRQHFPAGSSVISDPFLALMLALSTSRKPALARSTVGKTVLGEPAVVVENPQQNGAVRGVTVGRLHILPTLPEAPQHWRFPADNEVFCGAVIVAAESVVLSGGGAGFFRGSRGLARDRPIEIKGVRKTDHPYLFICEDPWRVERGRLSVPTVLTFSNSKIF
jgi:hypothetical protein